LVAADLGPVADPHEAAEPDRAAPGDLDLEALAEEEEPVRLPPPARDREQAPARVAKGQARVFGRQHAVSDTELDQSDHGNRDSRWGPEPGWAIPRLARDGRGAEIDW